MATKFLDRLRRTLFKEGVAPAELGPPEECPESSELDDDTDCVSSRLSGTLSFEGERGLESEDPGENSEPDSDSDFLGECTENGSDSSPVGPQSLLTQQLQESWRRSQSRYIPEKLVFEVTDASVVQEGTSKYVLYTIHVIRSGTFDKTPAVITRRYRDFEQLHRRLRRRYGGEMEGVSFPRKKLRRNFAAETIAKRSRAFEQYLTHVHSRGELRQAPVFLEFFYLGDLLAGQSLLRTGLYQEALGSLVNALRLQEKLGFQPQLPPHKPRQHGHWLFTLSALVACFQELDQLEEAQEYCERALKDLAPSRDALQQQQFHHLLIPLLQANVRLSWKISKDKRQWEALLQELRNSGVDVSNQPSLKEYLVKESLEDCERDARPKVKGDVA
ncbi:sorting nexin-21 [Lepisosteus oculatus]|uniref:sorting nexin-21 n=1 Tax=Lepisosteus oculatus TaxID=7918 RepID=UPI0035F510E1